MKNLKELFVIVEPHSTWLSSFFQKEFTSASSNKNKIDALCKKLNAEKQAELEIQYDKANKKSRGKHICPEITTFIVLDLETAIEQYGDLVYEANRVQTEDD